MPMVYVCDKHDYNSITVEFEVELTEEIVRDFLDHINSDEDFSAHTLDEWDEIFEKDQRFVEYVEDVYEEEISEKVGSKIVLYEKFGRRLY